MTKSNHPPQVDEIFDKAVRLAPGEEREQFLAQACGDQVELKQRVERLLRAVAEAGSFLESPVTEGPPTIELPIAEKPGTQIGPYKLLQEIGEGGMGVVYMAEQSHPVKRRVALKLVKPGMDSRQVIARFEAERQALALMDHPNIARVLDCGTTEHGRPYFVMELVKGIPITKYCDENHLTPRERLELFIPICQAIQHAHQKGIIHRDIKPSNILVAEYDQKPVPKIIDFGVAKALNAQLTDLTMFTQLGQVVGTLEYMSPEQSRVNQLDVDTRSDIYSLGVLLYELLTGATPFDRKRFRAAAFDEMLRIIREEEPPRPSTRLSTIDTLPSIAANRKTEPKKLSSLLKGELDWIVMKALEKDRARRYETATGFANDIQRYLSDEPVAACPPSAGYKFQKFARRNKVALATASLVAAALVIGLMGTAWQAAVRRSAEFGESAESIMHYNLGCGYALAGDKEQAFAEIRRSIELGESRVGMLSRDKDLVSLREDPQFAELEEQLKWSESFVAGREKYQAGQHSESIADFTRAIELNPNFALVYEWRGSAYRNSGQTAEADADFDRYVALYRQAAEAEPQNWVAWQRLAKALSTLQRWDEALAAVAKAAELAPDKPGLSRTRASFHLALSQWPEADAELSRLLEKYPSDWQLHYHRALARLAQDDLAGYRAACAEMLTAFAGTQDPVAANFAAWTCCLAPAAVDDWTVPLALARQATTAQPDSQQNQNTLGFVLLRAGKFDEAIKELDSAAARLESGLAATLTSPAYTWFGLALAHQAAGHADQARSWHARAAAEAEKQLGEPSPPPHRWRGIAA